MENESAQPNARPAGAAGPPPRHFLFDWNGTLQDDLHAAVAGTNAILADQGRPPIDAARYRDVFSFPARGCYEALGIDVEHHDWDALCERFFSVFSADPAVRLFPGAAAALRALRAAGATLSIVSSSEENELERALARHGVRDLFDAVSGHADAAAGSKIARARAVFAALGAAPGAACVVGDTGHDKEVADALGCACVLVASGYESRVRLERRGAPVLDSVADLPAFFGLPSGLSPS
ncbi:MAG: HAD family hydrolase [Kiritimatiellae bacterium]|nr:HAD family hydrolase [Kiritimatiellia bacterium]